MPCFEFEITVKICFENQSECMHFYGEQCQYPCSINCINQTCDKINGSCLFGCKEGHQCDEGIFD